MQLLIDGMLLSDSSTSPGIPKSPSFHSGTELAAAKNFNFLTHFNAGEENISKLNNTIEHTEEVLLNNTVYSLL